MEDEVKINDPYSNLSLIDKIKARKNLIIICSVVFVIIICFFYFRSGSSSAAHYDYLIVGSGLYGATFNYLAKKAGKTT